jgi:hypothetical protein
LEAVTGGLYALILAGIGIAVLVALLAPAPAYNPETEPDVPTSLLVGACVATLLMGAFALADHHVAAVIAGAAAGLIVVPCLWLARAPDWWEDEDEDDDGGSPRPGSPFAPPAPDDRLPGPDPSGRTGAQGAWVATPAVSFAPATAEAPLPAWAMRQGSPAWAMAQAQEQRVVEPYSAEIDEDLYEQLPITDPVWEPVPVTAPQCDESEATAGRLPRRSANRVRGEHRSVTHLPTRSAAHPRSRPHRPTISRRVLQACRRWLWIDSPDSGRSSGLNALEHGGRRHGSPVRTRSDRRDAISR